MGNDIVPAVVAVKPPSEGLLPAYAHLLHARYGATLYLFGSRTRGSPRPDSDYDLVAVSDAFATQPLWARAPDRRVLWRRAGGWGVPLDLHCYTRDEFRRELSGSGYLAQAKARGELRRISAGRPPCSSPTLPKP